MRKWVWASSALAPVAMIGGWSLAQTRQPAGFDPIVSSISALAAHGATDRQIMTTGLFLLGACHLATAAGLSEAGRSGRALLALGGAATLAVAALPQPAAGHVPAAAIAFVCLALWSLPARVPRLGVRITAISVLAVLLGWLAVALASGELLGLSERILAAAESVWPLAVVAAVARRPRRPWRRPLIGSLTLAVVAAMPVAAPQTAEAATILRTMVIGHSVQGRPIVAYELGDRTSGFTAVILGSMHGYRERAGETVTRAIRSGPPIRGVHLWVIDTINPDGDALRQRGNAHGVDLNRNWPNLWAPIAPSGDRFQTHYSGPAALSEPETRAMYAFLHHVRPQRLVSMHQPLGGIDTTDGGARDPAFRQALAHRLGLPQRPFTCLAVCHGSMTGWLTRYQSGAAITVEFGTSPSPAFLARQAAPGVVAAIMTGHRVPVPPLAGRNPVGHLDRAAVDGGGIGLAGWALDPDAPGWPLFVTFSDHGPTGILREYRSRTTRLRPDVNRVRHAVGLHGYSARLPLTDTGGHTVCATATNVGPGTRSTSLGCGLVVVPGPAGVVDGVRLHGGRIFIGGWAGDPLAPGRPGRVHLYVSGPKWSTTRSLSTAVARPDVRRHIAWAGAAQGFQAGIRLPHHGSYTVCAHTIGVARPGWHRSMGCTVIRA